MEAEYLHHRRDFENLIRTLSAETRIFEALIEKDYWILHSLHGLT